MKRTPKQLIDELGGYSAVASRLDVSPKTMHGYSRAKKIPSGYYVAFCDLAREMRIMSPTIDMFDFKPLKNLPVAQDGAA